MTSKDDIRILQCSTFDYVNSPVIRIHVGEEPGATDFFIHQDLVIPRSVFFSKAMNGGWKESTDRVVSLPEDDAEVFSIYMKLLYANKLPIKEAKSVDGETIQKEFAMLSKLCVLAEKLIDETTRNIVLAEMAARAAEPDAAGHLCCPSIDSVQTVYEGTPEDSPARQLVVRLYTDLGDEGVLDDDVDALPKDFLYDLSRSVLRARARPSAHDGVLKENKNLTDRVTELNRELDAIRPKPQNLSASPAFLSARSSTTGLFGSASQPYSFGATPTPAPRTNSSVFGGAVRNA